MIKMVNFRELMEQYADVELPVTHTRRKEFHKGSCEGFNLTVSYTPEHNSMSIVFVDTGAVHYYKDDHTYKKEFKKFKFIKMYREYQQAEYMAYIDDAQEFLKNIERLLEIILRKVCQRLTLEEFKSFILSVITNDFPEDEREDDY